MGKKRKSRREPSGQAVAPQSSKLIIDSFEDVANSEDEFHIAQDKILLDEGPEVKRRRKAAEDDEFLQPSEDEVFAQDDDSDEDDYPDRFDVEDGSDDYNDNLEDIDVEAKAGDGNDGDEDEGWGSSRKDYYDADVIETEQDALEEEAEARRLQQKQLESMAEQDFGLDDIDEAIEENDTAIANGSGHKAAGQTVTETLPGLSITKEMGSEERLDILRARYPEFEPLAAEFTRLQSQLADLTTAAKMSRKLQRHFDWQPPAAIVKQQALATYLASIAMYFSLLSIGTSSDEGPLPPSELRDHPVIDALSRSRDLWARAEHIKIQSIPEPSIVEEETVHEDVVPVSSTIETTSKPRRVSKKLQREQIRAEAALRAAEDARAERLRETEASFASLPSTRSATIKRRDSSTQERTARATKKHINGSDLDSDIGEDSIIDPEIAAEKAAKRKSLRFYTSRLAQREIKGGGISQAAASGDTDIPHRERLRDRLARLNEEAERRGKKAARGKEQLSRNSDDDDDDEDRVRAQKPLDDQQDYYELITQQKQAKKSLKEDNKLASTRRVPSAGMPGQVEANGKRAVGYTIDKNKGLMQKRNKINRNPRVKKKLRYEASKKKLASMKPIYKGGQGGVYGGELTGIKTGLVRGVKL